ncbi:zinc finger BED domain-containing protein 5-like [Palaemon carinicauda]|uniref:zinc finger BED domain-containing protein 5-like n=1 Tax=Palaemon carinicauda TaxID=392227 RepID=UPI0035B6889C
MIGVKGGFVTLVKNEWPHVTSSHCSLHRYALASKTLPPRLLEVMDVAVKVINFIRAKAKNHRLFQLLANEMGAQHVGLLFYTKVRWLSRGKCLSQLYELRLETEIFLRQNENNLHVHFDNEEYVMMLAYLADIFGRLNEMNQSLQGHDVTISDVQDNMDKSFRIALESRAIRKLLSIFCPYIITTTTCAVISPGLDDTRIT